MNKSTKAKNIRKNTRKVSGKINIISFYPGTYLVEFNLSDSSDSSESFFARKIVGRIVWELSGKHAEFLIDKYLEAYKVRFSVKDLDDKEGKKEILKVYDNDEVDEIESKTGITLIP